LELYQQLNARLYRQGQQNSVIIHHLITKGTIDENVIKALEQKNTGQNSLIDAVKWRLIK
jgi:SNF2 family DNA or RNA helicase